MAQEPEVRPPTATAATGAGWSVADYSPSSGEFNTAMVHLFRAEVHRANTWRQRLDATTNWAVITTGAALSFVFGEISADHSVILLISLLITLFLFIEARRYRYYELWSSRIRLLETYYFAPMLTSSDAQRYRWTEELASSLRYPRFSISLWEAVGRRLRRNYLWIYLLLGIVWFLKVWMFPTSATSWMMFFERAALAAIPGEWITLLFALFNTALIAVALATMHLREAAGEVAPYDNNDE
jgi:uncharacterized membrane protein